MFRTLAWLALLVLLVGAALVHLKVAAESDELTSIVRLAEVVGSNRTMAPRLVGGFQFGRIQTERRGGPTANNLKLIAEAGALQAAARTNPAGSQVHAWGLAQLMLGDADAAVSTLENLTDDRLSPLLLANLGASYAARAASRSDPSDWYRSLAYTERALRAMPESPEALFNKALALETLRLRGEADVAWRQFLDRDSSSRWAAEARERLARAEAQSDRVDDAPPASLEADLTAASAHGRPEDIDTLIAADPENVRKLIEGVFFRRLIDGQFEPSVAVRIADRFSAVTADSHAHDLYAVLTSDPRARAAAVSLVGIADASAQSRFDDLRLRVQAAPPAVEAFRPIALWVRYYRLQGQAENGVGKRLESDLAMLEAEAAQAGYLHLRGTVANRIGQVLGRSARQQDAIAARSRAVTAFTDSRSPDQVATMEVLIAESFRLLGDLDRAFLHHQRSLQLSDGFRTYRTRHQVLVQAGLTATAAGLHETAVAFFSEARRNALRWVSVPAAAVITTVRLSSALELSGADEPARVLIDEAARLLEAVPDPAFRQRTELELLEVRAGLLPPLEGIAELNLAIERFGALGSAVRLPQLYLAKARRLSELSQPVEALAAVERGLDRVRASRQSVSDQALRRSQADMFVDLQTEAAKIFLARGDHRSALARLDSIKAMSIEDTFATAGLPVMGETSLLPSLHDVLVPTSAVLVLADVGGRTDGWFLTTTALRYLPGIASTANLRSEVRRFRDALSSGNDERARSAGVILGRRILDPLRGELSHLSHLAIVPSAEVAGLPFAALRIDADTRYLVEAVTLSVSPSLELLRRWSSSAGASGPRRVLIAVSEGGRDQLPSLPHAREEAHSVAALYRHAVLTDGATETNQSFRDSYRDADLFHFVGHARFDQGGDPTLVLGPDRRTDLTADRIRELGTGRLRTVVLSACSSVFTDGDSRTIDGLLSTARPFLALGVPEVVGMLWDVQDDDASRLSLELHRELAAGREASVAVAMVQREAIATHQPPAEWTALQVLSAPSNPNRLGASQ